MNTIIKILIAEHDANDLELLHYELKKSGIQYVSQTVIDGKEFRGAIKNFIPDIILSDYTFPAFDGALAFEIKEQIAPDIPFIVVSGTIGEEKSVELIKNGVTDYALKDKLFTLPVKIKRALEESRKKREKDNADQALQKALTDLQKIMDSSLDVICAVNVNGIFLKVSAASETVWGYKPEELIGKPLINFVYPGDREKTQVSAANVMTGNNTAHFENRYVRKDGSLVSLEWTARWDEKDQVRYGVARDVTEKKRLEKAFETERQRFYDLFLQAPSSMGILKGPDHVFEMANPLYLKLIGKTDILGKPVKEVLPEVVEQGFIEILNNVYNTGKPFSGNEMLVQIDQAGDGKLAAIYLNFVYQAYKDGESSIQGILFFINDVTEQVVSRKKIQESENRFRALIEKSAEMKTLSTKYGKIIYSTPSIFTKLGYTTDEYSLKYPQDIIHPEELQGYLDERNKIVNAPGKSFEFQQRRRHKKGRWIWCEGTVTNMLEEPGIYAMVSNINDISERKLIEQQREFDKNNLDALINNTKDLMWSVDKDFKLITSNQPFDAIMLTGTAVAKGEIILSTDFSAKQIKRFKLSYQRAFAGESFAEIEYTNIPTESWLEVSYHPIRNGNEVIGAACHSRDITQLKLNEIAIKDDRILLRTLIDNLPAIIYTKDVYSKKTLSNFADYTHLGAESEKEVLGKDDSYFFSEEAAKITAIEEQHIFYTGESMYDKEAFYERKDGRTAWLSNSKIPLRNQQNEIVGLIGIGHDITERKRTEEALKKSEAFNRGVLNSLSSHIAVIDAGGNIVAVNEAWKSFGTDNGATALQHTAIGSNYYEVCEKSGNAGVEMALEVLRAMKGVMEESISSFYLEYPCHSPNEQRWFGMRAMKFESDEPMIVVSHMNITERKLAEEALQLTQFSFDKAGDAIYWMTQDARIVNMNEAACDSLGYTREELLKLSVPGIDPHYNQEVWSRFFPELREKGSLFFESVQQAKDGRIIPVEIRANYIKFGDAELSCAFVRDITERKKTQEHLLHSEGRLREIFDTVPETLVIFDCVTWTFVNFNDNALKMFKYSAEEFIKKGPIHISPRFQPDGRSSEEKAKEVTSDAMNGGKPIFEWLFLDANGKEILCEVRLAILSNIGSLQLLGSFIDITERKSAELKLEQQNAELTKINFELDRFVYSVSHELRAPLTSALGLLNFIEEESKEHYTLEYAGLIKSSINRLDAFIKNILSYSRNNRTEVQALEIHLQKAINVIVGALCHMKEAEGINFEVDVQEHVPFYSDLQSFNAIMENLISNAIKFQKEEIQGRYIKITGKSDKHNLHLCIEDNGIGIASKHHADIFKMFFRLSGKTGGTGLGLYIVKEMVNKLHGSISVNSGEGTGTSFTLTLKNLIPINIDSNSIIQLYD